MFGLSQPAWQSGGSHAVSVLAGVRPTQMHAEQEAALRMLHLLEHSDVQLLQGSADNAQQDSNPLAPSVHETLQPSITGSHTPDHPGHMAGGDQESVLDDHGGVHVLYGGHDNHPEPAPGKMAKVCGWTNDPAYLAFVLYAMYEGHRTSIHMQACLTLLLKLFAE